MLLVLFILDFFSKSILQAPWFERSLLKFQYSTITSHQRKAEFCFMGRVVLEENCKSYPSIIIRYHSFVYTFMEYVNHHYIWT